MLRAVRAVLLIQAEAVHVEQRAAPGSQAIQLYDVALLAHHFNEERGMSSGAVFWGLHWKPIDVKRSPRTN